MSSSRPGSAGEAGNTGCGWGRRTPGEYRPRGCEVPGRAGTTGRRHRPSLGLTSCPSPQGHPGREGPAGEKGLQVRGPIPPAIPWVGEKGPFSKGGVPFLLILSLSPGPCGCPRSRRLSRTPWGEGKHSLPLCCTLTRHNAEGGVSGGVPQAGVSPPTSLVSLQGAFGVRGLKGSKGEKVRGGQGDSRGGCPCPVASMGPWCWGALVLALR